MKISFQNSTSIFKVNSVNDLSVLQSNADKLDVNIYLFLKDWFSIKNEINVNTSGSTGKPSNISISKESMRQSAKLTLDFFELKENDFIVNCLPVKYIAGKMMLIRALIGNLHIHLLHPTDAPLCNFPKKKIYFTALTPSQVEKSLLKCPFSMDNIETILIGGAPISSNLKKQLQTKAPNCYASYGMTETITHIALQKINNGIEKEFTTLNTIDIDYQENSCLSISAPHLLNSPILTNDIVNITSESTFKWLGRADFVINSGGVKLFPEMIESKISKLIKGAFFIHKIKDSIYSQVPVIVLEQEQPLNWSAIQRAVTKIELPKAIFHNNSFVYTETGKINRPISFKYSKEIDK